MLIHSLLERTNQEFPQKEAIWFRNRWTSYSTLERESNQIAAFLIKDGLHRGERAAILMENSSVFVSIYFGILKAGGVVVGLNTETSGAELEYLVLDSEAKYLFISPKHLHLFQPVIRKLKKLNSIIICGDDQARPDIGDSGIRSTIYQNILAEYSALKAEGNRCIDLDLAEIVYTSGSTGKPKGVMLSHLNLASNMASIAEYLHLTESDRVMVVLPFTYIYGKSLLLTHIMTGGSLVIDNRFIYPNTVLETMHQTSVTGFAGVPSTFSILLNHSSLKKYTFPSLRYVTQAGGHMAPALQTRVAEAFHPAQLFVMYGATEAAPRLSYLEPSHLSGKLGSIGKPVPNVDLFVADEKGNPLPAGQHGELAARGSNIMQGYWKDPEGTREVLKHGLYFTGDLGMMDEDGFLFVVGRKKEIIKVKGYRVSAKEIEEKILELQNVLEAAVIGVPDPTLGEAVKACIVLRDGSRLTEKDILAHLKKHLSGFKLPKYIEFFESLPKNKSGKIMKTQLQKESGSKPS